MFYLVNPFNGPQTWFMAGERGVFVLSAQDAMLFISKGLVAEAGVYTVAGQSVNLFKSVGLVAAQGTFALNAQVASFIKSLRLTADRGTFVMSAQAAALLKGLRLDAATASFAMAAQAADLRANRIVADRGIYALAGQAAGLLYGRRLDAAQATLSLAAQLADLRKTINMVAAQATFTMSAQDAQFVRRQLAADVASFALAAQDADLVKTSNVRTFTFIGYCQSSSGSLNWSALSAGTRQAGDLAVYIDYNYGSGITQVIPSGFTNHISTSIGSPLARGLVSTKIMTGSESSVTGMNQDARNKLGLVFRPSTPFTTVTASGITSEMTAGNPTSKVCDPSAETSAVIAITIAAQESSTAALVTRTPAADATILSSDSDLLAAYNIYNTSPASITFDMNDLGDANWLAGIYFTFS